MRLSAGSVANALAWAVLIGLIAVASVMVQVLGPFGLVVLGLISLFICTAYELNHDTPSWGTEVFRARMRYRATMEERASVREDRRVSLSPLHFFRCCGAVLVVAGLALFVWQYAR
jgi:hypothetical protein